MRFEIRVSKKEKEPKLYLELYEDSDGDIVLDVIQSPSDERRTLVLFTSEGTTVHFPNSADKEWFEKRGILVK